MRRWAVAVQLLLDARASVNRPEATERRARAFLICGNHVKEADRDTRIPRKEADRESRPPRASRPRQDGVTPLYMAAQQGQLTVMRLLLDHDVQGGGEDYAQARANDDGDRAGTEIGEKSDGRAVPGGERGPAA